LKSALLSRARVYVLEQLTDAEMLRLLRRAREQALGHLHLDDTAAAALIAYADGDARRCLNLLEQTRTAADAAGVTAISAGFIQEALTPHLRRFDKGGENFYDRISALHKSVRGSHPDAALYWVCRMLDGGVDRRYVLRRLTAVAWDDIGLADPRAIQVVNAAAMPGSALVRLTGNWRSRRPRSTWRWPRRAMPHPAPSGRRWLSSGAAACRCLACVRPAGMPLCHTAWSCGSPRSWNACVAWKRAHERAFSVGETVC
jgi:hypothetical protein